MSQITRCVDLAQNGKKLDVNGNIEVMLQEEELMEGISTSKGTYTHYAHWESQLPKIREIRLGHMLPYFLDQLNDLSGYIDQITSAVSHPLLDALVFSYRKSGQDYDSFSQQFDSMFEANDSRRVRIDLHRIVQVGVFLELIRADPSILKTADESIVYSPHRLFSKEKTSSWKEIRTSIADALHVIYPDELENLMNIAPAIFLDKSPVKKVLVSGRKFYFPKGVLYGFSSVENSPSLEQFAEICEDWRLRKMIYESASEGLSIISSIVFGNGKISTESNLHEFFLKPYREFKHYMENYAANQFLWVWRELGYKDIVRSTLARQNRIDAQITSSGTMKVTNLRKLYSDEYFARESSEYEKQFKATTGPLPLLVYTLMRWQQGISKYS